MAAGQVNRVSKLELRTHKVYIGLNRAGRRLALELAHIQDVVEAVEGHQLVVGALF